MRYTARAPLRIDFGGGWTDVPMYAEREGGAVLNAAITRYARGRIVRPEGEILWKTQSPSSFLGQRAEGMLASLRGGSASVSYHLELPAAAGLGASAAQTVLWVTLVKTTIANVSERQEVAEIACQIAALLGIVGGKQDEYASALGGITFLTFGDQVQAQRLELSPVFSDQFRSRLVLVYSGRHRLSGDIHEHVWARYRQGERSVVDALAALKRLAGEMRDALTAQDLDAFGELLNENWANQKALDPSVSNDLLDDIFDLARSNGARGGKACGAGGGGCLLFLASEGEADRLCTVMKGRKLQLFHFDFDSYGVHLTKG